MDASFKSNLYRKKKKKKKSPDHNLYRTGTLSSTQEGMGGGTGSGTQNKEPLLTDDVGCGKSREFPLFSSVSCTKYYNFKHIYRVCTNRKWLQSTIRLGEITAPPAPRTEAGGVIASYVHTCALKSLPS